MRRKDLGGTTIRDQCGQRRWRTWNVGFPCPVGGWLRATRQVRSILSAAVKKKDVKKQLLTNSKRKQGRGLFRVFMRLCRNRDTDPFLLESTIGFRLFLHSQLAEPRFTAACCNYTDGRLSLRISILNSCVKLALLCTAVTGIVAASLPDMFKLWSE